MPQPEPTPTSLPTDLAAIDLLAAKLGQVVREAVSREFAKLREPPRTGVALQSTEPIKAVAAKQEIESKVLDRQGLIDVERLAKLLSISRATVWNLISCEAMPKPIHLGRCVRWREVEILAWLEAGCPTDSRWGVNRKEAIREYERSRRPR